MLVSWKKAGGETAEAGDVVGALEEALLRVEAARRTELAVAGIHPLSFSSVKKLS